MRLTLAALALAALAGCSSTPAAKSPVIAKSAAVVEYGAEAVHVADVACAAAGAELRASGNAAKAADVTGKCVAALKPAADTLEGLAAAIYAGKAISDSQIACGVALSLEALASVRVIMADVGKPLPDSVDKYVKAATPWLPVAEGMVCKS